VPELLHRQIKEAAERSGRTMSDEMAWRVGMSFEWEAAFGEVRQWKAKKDAEELESALRRAEYTPVAFLQPGDKPTGVAWIEPGMDTATINFAIDVKEVATTMLPDIQQALARALGKFAKTGDDK
jgi:hypothetical protein